MSLPDLPEKHVWHSKVHIIKGDLFDPTSIEAIISLSIKYKKKWYIPAKTVRSVQFYLKENTSLSERRSTIREHSNGLVSDSYG